MMGVYCERERCGEKGGEGGKVREKEEKSGSVMIDQQNKLKFKV